ncbi:MAG: hypothetical protein U0807_13415 [Candidatus Binatia bacterium]
MSISSSSSITLCAVSIEDGHVAPAAPLDLHARSDFGRVLGDLWRTHAGLLHRGTVVVVLGDARNNRFPPRADLLRAVRERVQRHRLARARATGALGPPATACSGLAARGATPWSSA